MGKRINKRKCIFNLIFLMCILSFMGCTRTSRTRPIDYAPSKWVSEEPDMWFIVPEQDHSAYTYSEPAAGEITIEGQKIPFQIWFTPVDLVTFYNDEGDLFDGICKFSPEKMTVKIRKSEEDKAFHGTVDKIVFVRVPMQ